MSDNKFEWTDELAKEFAKVYRFFGTSVEIFKNAHLRELQKTKQPIFSTNDGIDIYEGDKYWYVNSLFQTHTIAATITRQWDKMLMPNERIFSTEQAAKEYIQMNKPKHSIQNIIDLLNEIENIYSNNSKFKQSIIDVGYELVRRLKQQ